MIIKLPNAKVVTFEYEQTIFGQTKNGLVSGRLACTSSKTEIGI